MYIHCKYAFGDQGDDHQMNLRAHWPHCTWLLCGLILTAGAMFQVLRYSPQNVGPLSNSPQESGFLSFPSYMSYGHMEYIYMSKYIYIY